MWDDFKPEEVVGKDKIIDKVELVKDFLYTKHEMPLTDPEKLSTWLKKDERMKKSGVYCIYNKKNEVLYVGKSKNLKNRIREQLIGRKDRKSGLLKFTRLFHGVLKKEENMNEKEYNELSDERKRELINFYQSIVFESNNVLRVCFTEDDIKARVLENTLIKYFSGKGQCKYNFRK